MKLDTIPEIKNVNGILRQVNWTSEDVKNFISDFCCDPTAQGIQDKAEEVSFERNFEKEENRKFFSEGYQQALMDIYKQIN